MTGSYDLGLVALSVVIAILASSAALDLANRVTATRGRARALWLGGGAFAMGSGIWSMHYVGMLAFRLPVPVLYDVPTVVASLLAAVFASAVALFVVSGQALGPARVIVGSAVMGAGIAAMHYTGMAAMRMPATITYDRVLFTLSVLIAIVVALVALVLAFHLRSDTIRAWDWRKVGSSLLMGAAIPAMHYTGMAAADFAAASEPGQLHHALAISSLGTTAIAGSTFLVLALALGTSMLDRHLARHAGVLSRFAAIVESSHDAIVATTMDGTVVAWNPGAERLWGYGAGDVLGRSVSLLEAPARLGETGALIPRIAGGEQLANYETVRRRKDGSLVDVSITYSPIRDRAGEVNGISAIARNITERKQADAAMRSARDLAEQAAHARSAFLANMSHEIRTPMNAILGLTELALGSELTAEQRRQLELVHAAGEGLLTILNDVLDFSKIEGDYIELEAIAFDLPGLVHATARLLALKAAQQGVELVCDVSPDVPNRVIGDPGRLRQVLINLLGNAIKFTPAGEIVASVAVERQDRDAVVLRLAVRDTGVGIPADKLESIFDAFSQADVSTTRKYGGTGLGLAICRRLVRLMGGELRVTSEPGRGSEFACSLPLPAVAAPLPDAASLVPAPTTLAGLHTLVVDDNSTNRRLVRQMLAAADVVTDEAADASAALAALRRARDDGAPYGLVVIDAHMPERDGFGLAADVLAEPGLGGTHLLMLTSGGERGDAQRCLKLGIKGYLTKPVSQTELLDAARAVLDRHAGGTPAVVTRYTIEESRRTLRLLLAEDNPVNQEVAAAMLRKRGHHVDIVDNGREAVDAVQRKTYDVVLMDIQMPQMDGLAATRAIRALPGRQDQRVVAVTAHASGAEKARCLAAGMNGYLTKPFKAHQLFALVEEAPAAAPSATPPVDLDGFRRTMREAGAEEAVDGIVATFVSTLPQRLDALIAAASGDEPEPIQRAAHAFKSAAATLGARGLAALLEDIEAAARDGDGALARARLELVRSEARAVLEQLNG